MNVNTNMITQEINLQIQKYQRFWWLIIPLLGLLFWGGKWLFSNEKDPYWFGLEEALRKNYASLERSNDSLQALYKQIHPNDQTIQQDDSFAIKVISKPYLPTMTFQKFKKNVVLFQKRKMSLVAGVTGSGNSAVVSRIAAFLASGQDSGALLTVMCAPQFDLKLHEEYIGYFENGKFRKGKLVQLWEDARKNPTKNYVCLIDNFDKINPETFFGPQIWEKLSDAKFPVIYGKDTLEIPKNFYLLGITHAGVGSHIEFSDEHFKRLGGQVMLEISPEELILELRNRLKRHKKDLQKALAAQDSSEIAKLTAQVAALSDTQNVKRLIYFFQKTNELVSKRYGESFQIGQWSDIRKKYMPQDFEEVQKMFLSHVNGLHPSVPLREADFDPILYTIKTNGYIKNSSPFFDFFDWLRELGFLNEFGVASVFAALTGIFGWLLFSRRHEFIRNSMERIMKLSDEYSSQQKTYDEIIKEITQLRRQFDEKVLLKKINYTEASFFYSALEDKVRSIEVAQEVNHSFLKLVDVFLEDKILTNAEYLKLNQFLESIRSRISESQFLRYKLEIENIYQTYSQEKMN